MKHTLTTPNLKAMTQSSVQQLIPYLIFSMACLGFVKADDAKLVKKLHETTPQDCTYFLPDAQQAAKPVVQYAPDQVMASFLAYYFAPWENPFLSFSAKELHKNAEEKIQKYKQAPGWGLNRHPLGIDFMVALSDNMHLGTFPNCQQSAITVRATDLRTFPCNKPSFTDWVSAGEGYPFDNGQEALLAPNAPVYVLHTSQDGAWHFVVTDSYSYGWVQKEALAYVTPAFMAQWKTGQYITPLRDEVPVAGNLFAPLARVGQLIPLAQTQNSTETWQVLTVVKGPAGNASIKVCTVNKADTIVMPLLATPNNMARLANSLMGQPYGWCGLAGYRDCASIIKDLCMPFGIWMPVTTGPQAQSGTFVSLAGLKDAQKEALLKAQGVPFFSLIWWPGHITLYIGAQAGKVYVYHDVWGLRTEDQQGQAGRAVIGKVAITPLDFGTAYSNIKSSLLSKAQRLILLNNRLLNPHEELALHQK